MLEASSAPGLAISWAGPHNALAGLQVATAKHRKEKTVSCLPTWKETAEKRPRHMNWDTFTKTAQPQLMDRMVMAGTVTS